MEFQIRRDNHLDEASTRGTYICGLRPAILIGGMEGDDLGKRVRMIVTADSVQNSVGVAMEKQDQTDKFDEGRQLLVADATSAHGWLKWVHLSLLFALIGHCSWGRQGPCTPSVVC